MAEKTMTIQDVLDSSGEQLDLIHLVIGAAVSNKDLSSDPEVVSQYDALSVEQKEIINFIVGAKVSKELNLKHTTDVEEFLSHFGVKGMRWGIRKDDGPSGNPAALKSTGRRVANGILGDKTFWRNTAIIAGATGAGVAASLALPSVIPAATLVTIAQYGGGALGLSGYATTASLAAFGSQIVTTLGLGATALVGGASLSASYLANIGRAFLGNQKEGMARVNKILDKEAKHSDLSNVTLSEAEEHLAHYGIKGMRWGIRRSDAELARARGESEDAYRARKTANTIAKTKTLSSVEDADLNHLVNRINLEKRYSEVTAQTKAAPFSALDARAKKLLGFGATLNTAYNFANSPAGRILAEQLGFYKPGPGKHAGLPKNVIDLPSSPKRGRHRA